MKRLILTFFIVLIALPVFAQDDLTDEQQEAVAVVIGALDALGKQDSYVIQREQNLEQGVTIGTVEASNNIVQTADFQVAKTDEGYNVVGTLVQDVSSLGGGQTVSYTLTFDLVLLDGIVYMQASDSSGTLSQFLPDGWVNLTEDPEVSSNPVLSSFNAQLVESLYKVVLPIDADTITSIEELDAAEVDGEAVRVFELTIATEAMMSSGLLPALSQFVGTAQESALLDIFEDAELFFTFYVGEDDGLLHQMESSLSLETEVNGQDITLQQNSTTIFSGFNEPVTIEAPEVE